MKKKEGKRRVLGGFKYIGYNVSSREDTRGGRLKRDR